MATKRSVKIFTAGCPVCDETVQLVQRISCDSCEVTVLDVKDAATAERAKEFGVRTVPAVAVNGALASCCNDNGPNEQKLRAAGVGQTA